MSKKKSSVFSYSPLQPRVPIEIQGKTFQLFMGINAFAEFERLTGVNAFEVIDFTALNVTNLRAMLYAALLTDQPHITLEDAGNLLFCTNIVSVTAALMHSWAAARPELSKEDAEAAKEENPPVADEKVSE